MKNKMKKIPENWEVKKLGELFDVKSSRRVHKADWKKEGVPFYRAREVVMLSKYGKVNNELFISEELFRKFLSEKGLPKEDDIIVSAVGTLGQCYLVKKEDRFYFKDASVLWFDKVSNVYTKYIGYAFYSDFIINQIMDKSRGATVGTLTISRAKKIQIPIPPLPEQKRIVAKLDKAFEAIQRSKNNAKQNLQNAKELFESYLNNVFENGKLKVENGEWEEDYFGNTFNLKSGDSLTTKNMVPGDYDVFGGNGISGKHNSFNNQNEIIIGRVGALCGNVRYIKRKFWLTDNAFKIVKGLNKFNYEFIVYLLNHIDLRRYARQSAQPVISNSSLKEVIIVYPKSITEQEQIVKKLDALSAETKKLEVIYQQKNNNLEELKKSILQKAFRGELKIGN